MSKNLALRKRIKKVIDQDPQEPSKQFKISSLSSPLISPKRDANLKVNDLRMLIKEDLRRTMDLHSSNHLTRDISHLQDKKLSSMISLPILPTDIEILRKLSMSRGTSEHVPFHCKREPCISEATLHKSKKSEASESIEKLLGNPTGRQDIKELCTWFHSMLSFHQNASIDTIILIYEQCAKELTRQVAVTCLERGELLQILFRYQNDLYRRKQEENEKKLESEKLGIEKEFKAFKEKANKKQKELDLKVSAYFKLLEINKVEKEKLIDELSKCKHKYNEFARKFMDEEKTWQQKHYALLMKLKENHRPVKISNHELSVVNWVGKEDELKDPENEFIQNEIIEYENLCIKNEIDNQEFLVQVEDPPLNSVKMLEIYESEINKELFEELKENDENLEILGKEDLQNSLDQPPQDELQDKPSAVLPLQPALIENPAWIEKACETVKPDLFLTEPESLSCFALPSESLHSHLVVSLENQIEFFPEYSKPDPFQSKPGNSRKSKKRGQKVVRLSEIKAMVPKDQEPVTKPEVLKQDPITKPELLKQDPVTKPELLKQDQLDKPGSEPGSKLSAFPGSDKLKLKMFNFSSRGSGNLNLNLLTSAKSVEFLSSPLGSRENPYFLSPANPASHGISPRSYIEDSEVFNKEDLEFADLMPEGCEAFSWKTGFCLGFEQGRKEGLRDGETLGLEEGALRGSRRFEDFPEETKTAENNRNSLRSSILKRKVNEVTKIMQFQFNRPENTKKQHPVHMLITKLLITGLGFLKKCSLSRKMINKVISSVLINSMAKMRSGDVVDSLVEQLYDDFYQKYGLKAVCEKRFIEFMSSLFAYSGFRRISVFIRLIGFGGKLGLKNYSNRTFKYYLNALSFMISSKVGVIIAFDDIADKQLFPTQRGIECLKEKIESITEKQKFAEFVNELIAASEVDNKGINPLGLVELELVLQMIADVYQDFQREVEEGVAVLLESFQLQEVLAHDFLMFLRWIHREKFDFNEEDSKRVRFSQISAEINLKEIYSVSEIIQKSLDFNVLKINDVHKFLPEGKNNQIDKKSLFQEFSELNNKLQISTNVNLRLKTESARIFQLWSCFDEVRPYNNHLALSLLSLELSRIKSELPLIY